MRGSICVCCASLIACAPATARVAAPRVDSFELDEADERREASSVPADASPASLPSADPEWADADSEQVGCVLDPTGPGCGPLLPPATIREAIRAEVGSLHGCLSTTDLQGSLGLSFLIIADGSVSEIELREDLPPDVDACLRRKIGALQFGPLAGEGSVRISYP